MNLHDFLTGIGFLAKYPYTDFHELNLDWIITEIAQLRVEFDDFAHVNSLKYAGEWDITKAYSAFSVVDEHGFGYMALKPVPPGTQITDAEYWLMVVDYSQILNGVESRMAALEAIVGDASSGLVKDVDDLQNTVGDASSGLVKDVNDLQNTVGDASSGLVKDVNDLQNTVGDASSGLVKDVDDLQNTVGDASSGLVKDVDDLQSAMSTAQGDIVTLNNKINAASTIYDTLTDLIADTNVVSGKYVQTLGRSSEGDNGGSFYYITDLTPSGYYETLTNGLFAKPIDAHNVLVFGVIGSGDETAAISAAIAEIDDYIEFNAVTYTISGELVFTQDIHGNGAKIKVNGDVLTAILTPGSVKELEVYSDASAHVRVGIAATSGNSIIEDCYVHDLYNDDVSTPNHSVFGIALDNTDRYGTAIARRNRVNNIVGTYLTAQAVYSAAGIIYSGHSNVLIENNIVTNVVDAYNGDCLSVIPKANDGTLVCTIRNNFLSGGQVDGMKVSFENAQIYENTIRFTGVNPKTTLPYIGIYGIRVQEAHNKITKNEIIDETSVNADIVYGIMGMYSGSGTQPDIYIDGNTIKGTRIQIYLSYYADSRITNNYLVSSASRSNTTGITHGVNNGIISGNNIDVHDISDSGSNTIFTSNNVRNCLLDTNSYSSKHTYSNNMFYKSKLNVTTDDIVDGNMFYSCPTPMAFVSGTGNIITSNRFSSSTPPTIPSGNTAANNV